MKPGQSIARDVAIISSSIPIVKYRQSYQDIYMHKKQLLVRGKRLVQP